MTQETTAQALAREYRGHADRVGTTGGVAPARAVLVEFDAANQPCVHFFGVAGAGTGEVLSLVSAATAQLAAALGSLNRSARS